MIESEKILTVFENWRDEFLEDGTVLWEVDPYGDVSDTVGAISIWSTCGFGGLRAGMMSRLVGRAMLLWAVRWSDLRCDPPESFEFI